MRSRSKLNPNSPEFHRLEELKRRLSEWRSTPTVGTRCIPDELWQEAADLSRALSPYFISRALGLEYAKLRRQMSEQDSRRIQRPHRRPVAPPTTPDTLLPNGTGLPSMQPGQLPDSVVAGFLEATIAPRIPRQDAVLLAEVIRPQGEVLRVFSTAAGDLVRAFLLS